jgi:hypothetical protein
MLRAAWALLSSEQCVAFFQRPEITTLKKMPEFEHFRHDRGRRSAMIQRNDKQLAVAGLDGRRLKALVRPRQGRERDPGCIPRSDVAYRDAAVLNGSDRIHSHGAPPSRMTPNGCLGSPAIVSLRS